MSLSLRRLGTALLVLLVVGAPLGAQIITADIVGTVTDASGAVLPAAKITVENLATGLARNATSDASGNFLFTLLPIGRYSVKAEIPGFRTFTMQAVSLAVGDRLRLDVKMEVGAIEQTIEVTAQTASLQSESSTVGTLVNERAVQDLPLNGRNFIRLAQLAAGANESVPNAMNSGNRPDDRRRTSAIAVNGQRDYANNFLIDGLDNNERYIGTAIVKPSPDALAEFRVQTNLYSAELGRTAGGVINLVTKSGSNALHGSLFEFFRNEKLDAKNFFAAPGPTPSYKQNQFGGSLGGPIKKDKTFFFGDYEGFRVRQGLTFASTVPTLAMRQGDFAGINPIFDPGTTTADPSRPGVSVRTRFLNDRIPQDRMDPVGVRLIQLYPAPIAAGLVNNFTQSPNRAQRDDTFDGKIDHRFSDSDMFFGRYSFNDTNSLLPPHLPAVGSIQAGGDAGQFAGSTLQRSQSLALNYTHTFRPNLLGEFKAGYARFVVHTLPPNFGNNVDDQIGLRGANIDLESSGLSPVAVNGFRGLGDSTSIPLLTINNVFQYMGGITYIRSSHNIKVGGDVRRRQLSPVQSSQVKGQFTFDPSFTNDPSGDVARSGNSAASLLLGYPAATVRQKLLVFPGFRSTEFAAYIQDDWRATRWLTLNFGVRYEVFTPFKEVALRAANFDVGQRKIITAGQNGVSSTAGVETDWASFAPRFGFAATVTPRTVVRGGFGLNFYPATSGTGSNTVFRAPPFVNVLAISPTQLTPLNRLSDGLPPVTPTDPLNPTGAVNAVAFNLRNSYVQQFNLTVQRELVSGLVWNAGYVGALTRHQAFGTNINLAPPGPGAINPRRPFFNTFPNAGAVNFNGPWGNGNYHSFQTGVEYRFRKGLNLMSNYTWAHLIDDNPGTGGGKPGTGPFPQVVDNRHIERGNSDIDLRQRWTLLVNYELPFGKNLHGVSGLVAKGWQVNAIAAMQTGLTLTVQNSTNRANTGGGDRPNVVGDPTSGDGLQTVGRWFNTAAFQVQPLYSIGNVGRNTLYGPPLKSLDFSLFKDFKPTERTTLQFRAETFNLTNHPNFGNPGNQLGTAAFGVISDTANALPRNIQFALKLIF